jgi:hypothetical protein
VGMLAKPIEPNVLLRRVERLLERTKGQDGTS